MEQQLTAQFRRTDEIQAQLDRAITELRLKSQAIIDRSSVVSLHKSR